MLLLIFGLSGCSGLFFFPDSTTYITPDRLDLEYEDVWLDTPDGERLHGWFIPAKGEVRGSVYFLHGNAQNISAHLLNVAWLPEQGYNLFMPDYRGYGRSSGTPDLDGAVLDAKAGLSWLARNHPEQPVILLGQSLGGALALVLASDWTGRAEQPPLHAVIVDGAFSGFRSIAQEKLADFWLTWPLQLPLSLTIPDQYDGVQYIAGISPTPLLIIHSARDGIIPYSHALRLLEAAGPPSKLLTTDTPHTATFLIPAYRRALLDFIEQPLH
jgi:fermentation-respiration switch protein FrsA (DUF1100 family)